jgi:hypothetical protein
MWPDVPQVRRLQTLSFLRRLIFGSATYFSKTSTIGASLAASFCGFFYTATDAKGGGTGAVSSFATPSSLEKN